MAKMNWKRVRTESLIQRHGSTDGKNRKVYQTRRRVYGRLPWASQLDATEITLKTGRFVPAHSDLYKVELDTITVFDIHGNPERVSLKEQRL
jgi:hypothetical protein